MNDPICPARTRGEVAGCRWCIYTPGGAPSELCLKLRTAWQREQERREREKGIDSGKETR